MIHTKKACPENLPFINFELIFDDRINGNAIYKLMEENKNLVYNAYPYDEEQEYNVDLYNGDYAD